MAKVNISRYQKKEKKASTLSDILTKDINFSFSGSRSSDSFKSKVYGQLGMLLNAGVDLKSCLDIVMSQQEKAKHQKILKGISDKVISGLSLHEAFKAELEITQYEFYSIKIGEDTGKLAHILNELSSFFEQKIEQRRKFISAFSYPAIVLTTAFLVVFFMLRFLVPMFDSVYRRFGGELPFITKKLVAMSEFLGSYSHFILFGLIVLYLFYYFNRNRQQVKKYKAFVYYRIPIFGTLLQKYYLARFTRFMYLLTSSKVPLTQALQLTRKVIDSYPIEQSLERVEKSVVGGYLLSEALKAHSIFDKKLIALVKVGEEVNQLDKMFKQLSEEYSREFEHQTDLLNKFLEPLIILFLGITVGVILVALYLPMFKLSNSFLF